MAPPNSLFELLKNMPQQGGAFGPSAPTQNPLAAPTGILQGGTLPQAPPQTIGAQPFTPSFGAEDPVASQGGQFRVAPDGPFVEPTSSPALPEGFFPSTPAPAPAEGGGVLDFFFGNPTPEQAQRTLQTQPTDPAQRERLQSIAQGTAAPSDLSQTGSFFFGRPEVAGDPNILGAAPETPSAFSTPEASPSALDSIGQLPSAGAFSPEAAGQVNPLAAPQDLSQPTPEAAPTSGGDFGPTGSNPRFKGQTPSQFMRGEDTAASTTFQGTDAQGRLRQFDSPEAQQANIAQGQADFAQASTDREARQAARPDFGEALSDRERRAARGDGISDADRRDMAKANRPGASAGDVARGNKVAALVGVDIRTGRPLEGAGVDTRTPEQIAIAEARAEGVRLENERKRQIIDKGNQPNATPRDKKISEFEQNAKEGAEAGILKPWEVEAQRKDFYGKPPPFGYSSWVQAGEQRVPPPSAAAIEKLEADPSLAPDFDAKFGEGEAAKILKKKMSFSDSR